MKHRSLSKSHPIYTIAVIGFVFTLHVVIPMYSNSSFLSLFADERTVGFIYMMGAAVTILGFLLAPPLIRRMGNYAMALLLVVIQIFLFYGLITAVTPHVIVILFISQMALASLIGLSLDIFLEVNTDGHKVGTIRGFYTTVLNASWLVGPLLGTILINGLNNYRNTYIASLAMLFPLLYLIHKNFPRFKDPHYTHLSPWQLIKRISRNPNWVRLFFANIILQFFYAWMIVYCPIYLHSNIGFSWEEIGIIFTIMLLPFVLIQYPLGKLADRKYGEKEMMAIGFGVMGVATILLSLLTFNSVFWWALMLFITRIGAAMAEIMLEIYFFKTVSSNDSGILGWFRIAKPFAFFMAPIVTFLGLLMTTHQYLFVIIGAIVLVAIYPALLIRDTK